MDVNLQTVSAAESLTQVEQAKFPAWKRAMDIIGALLALIVSSPLLFAISIIIWITEGRPILFRQERLGLGGVPFYIYKIRTMCANAEDVLKENPNIYRKYIENDYKLPEGEDPRITKFGHLLRKTSLDEFPQFLNVLKGEMSLVGPRPIVEDELAEYGTNASRFLSMKPGITGVWQVSGRSELKYPERVWLELSYIEKQTLWFDIKTMFQTVYCVVKRTGAH